MSYTGTMNETLDAPVEETVEEAPKHPLHRELNAADRCESYVRLRQYGADNGTCGAQAFFLVVFKNDNDPERKKETELLFCAHHFTKAEAKIREKAVYVSDQTADLLNVKASASSPD